MQRYSCDYSLAVNCGSPSLLKLRTNLLPFRNNQNPSFEELIQFFKRYEILYKHDTELNRLNSLFQFLNPSLENLGKSFLSIHKDTDALKYQKLKVLFLFRHIQTPAILLYQNFPDSLTVEPTNSVCNTNAEVQIEGTNPEITYNFVNKRAKLYDTDSEETGDDTYASSSYSQDSQYSINSFVVHDFESESSFSELSSSEDCSTSVVYLLKILLLILKIQIQNDQLCKKLLYLHLNQTLY